MKLSQAAPALLLPPLILLALLVFWPALSGPFLFDDLVHIPTLGGADGTTDTLGELTRLVFPTHQGTGRSLSYLSLLINDNAWPTYPRSFKYTNLMVHCLNGVLVLVLARLLARSIGSWVAPGRSGQAADWVGLIAMALWLVHPIHLSPMMIVIQRMTLLAGTFSLLALIAYVHGRRVAFDNPMLGYVWMVPVFGLCLLLGLLSKDTAAMTICFVIALEATVLGRDTLPRPLGWRIWAAVFLVLPLALIATYLVAISPIIVESYANRDFTLGERLMTEGRVLMQYLRVILIPSLSQTGPFQDDFVPSRGLLDPATTLAALLAIAALLGLALWGRRRWPVFALAVLWFFLGHVLEGTVIPLELYFEHRNYLPMFGICFAVSYGLISLAPGLRRLASGAIILVLALQAGISYLSAGVWGNTELIAVVWGAEHPASPRAQILTLRYWAARGDGEQVRDQLDRSVAITPREAGFHLYRLIIDRCSDERLPKVGGSMEDLEQAIRGARYDAVSLEVIKWLTADPEAARCRFTDAEIARILDLYSANPVFTQSRVVRNQLYLLYAGFHQRRGDLEAMSTAIDQAFAALPSYEMPLDMASFFILAGDFQRAEAYLDKAATAPITSPYDWLWRDRQVRDFGAFLAQRRQAAAGQAGSGNAPAPPAPHPTP
jgi:hypothetical protein